MPTTTPWPRASSPRPNANSSTAGASKPTPRPARPSSLSSKDGTIPAGGILPSAISRPWITKRGRRPLINTQVPDHPPNRGKFKPRMPVNQERLRDLMRRVMIRNTRAVVALRLPRRHATTHRVEGGPAERSCYEELNRLVRATAASAAPRNRLALRHLLSAAGSSPAAAAAAVNRYAERQSAGDAAAWADLAKHYAAIPAGGKEAALVDLLKQNPQEKKLVFVHHRDTLASLAALLREQRI